MKKLIELIILVFFFGWVSVGICSIVAAQTKKEPTMNPILKEAMDRSVKVSTDNGYGTGVIVKTNLVLTCFHVLDIESGVQVDGVDATIVKVDPKHDLLLLEVPTPKFFPPKLPQGIELDEPVFFVGNPDGMTKFVSHGRIAHMTADPPKIIISANALHGASGSGVWKETGEFVGIVDAIVGEEGVGYPFTKVIPLPTILKFIQGK